MPDLRIVLACLVAGCGVLRPSELSRDETHLVVVKSVQLPDWMPPVARLAQHSFFDVKAGREDRWRRLEIRSRRSGVVRGAISPESARSDERWGRAVEVVDVTTGPAAARMIERLEELAADYESRYVAWPGPNSNTFVDRLVRDTRGLRVELHHDALGKDFAFLRVGTTTTGSGLELETPILGVQVGLREGVELHFLQLTFGVSLYPPALKLPFLPRLGYRLR